MVMRDPALITTNTNHTFNASKPSNMDTDGLVCVKLRNGVRMPTLAYSVSSTEIGGTTLALETALKAGYRHIVVNTVDTNELEIGHVVRRWIETKNMNRRDFFITVKISFDEGERVNLKSRFVQTLYTLSCDNIDLLVLDADSLQCNNRGGTQNDVKATVAMLWKGAVALQKEGTMRSVGVVCNDDEVLNMLCTDSEMPPHVIHLNYTDTLNTRTFQSSAAICRKYSLQALIDIDELERIQDVNNSRHDEVILNVSKQTGRTQEQVLIRSCLERGMAVVARFAERKSIQGSFQVLDFSIQRKDMINLCRSVT